MKWNFNNYSNEKYAPKKLWVSLKETQLAGVQADPSVPPRDRGLGFQLVPLSIMLKGTKAICDGSLGT